LPKKGYNYTKELHKKGIDKITKTLKISQKWLKQH
jgi:hypothetical protein